jgi:hypothetical protein
MSITRAFSTTLLAFVASQVLAAFVHGYLLAADYAPYEGTLLRVADGDQVPWQMIFLPVAHLSFIGGLVWLYTRLNLHGAVLVRGATLGVVGWLIGQVPLWLIWYAQQPWPGLIVVKQLGLELISAIVVGVVIAAVAGMRATSHATVASGAG